MGLYVDNALVTGSEISDTELADWANLVCKLLRKTPNLDEFKNNASKVIRLSWVRENFKKLFIRADNEVVRHYGGSYFDIVGSLFE